MKEYLSVQEVNDMAKTHQRKISPVQNQETNNNQSEYAKGGNSSSVPELGRAIANTKKTALESFRSSLNKKERRTKRIQSLITQSTYDDLKKIAHVTGTSVNELFNIILEQHIMGCNLHNKSEEEISAILYSEVNSNSQAQGSY